MPANILPRDGNLVPVLGLVDASTGEVRPALADSVTGRLKTSASLTTGGGSFTQGSVIFAGPSGVLSQDNANLNFNDSTNVLTVSDVHAVSGLTVMSATATPAGGATGSGLKFGTTANLGIFFGSGAPSLSAAQGSLYVRTDGSAINNRLYVNTNGSTGWTGVTTIA